MIIYYLVLRLFDLEYCVYLIFEGINQLTLCNSLRWLLLCNSNSTIYRFSKRVFSCKFCNVNKSCSFPAYDDDNYNMAWPCYVTGFSSNGILSCPPECMNVLL